MTGTPAIEAKNELVEVGLACRSDALTSAFGYKETSSRPKLRSALLLIADILVAVTDFRL